VHVVEFPSAAALLAYRDDARRAEHRPLLERSGAAIELRELGDVPVGGA
jgi:hypothetical protein